MIAQSVVETHARLLAAAVPSLGVCAEMTWLKRVWACVVSLILAPDLLSSSSGRLAPFPQRPNEEALRPFCL